MKKMMCMAVAAMALLAACEKEDNGFSTTPKEVQEALMTRYPDAVSVEWESRDGYYVADFTIPGSTNTADNTAWFDGTGIWYMTEYDIPYNALPDAVQQAFKASEWGTWAIDDVDQLERDGMETLYIIEVEGRNSEGREEEVDLYFSHDGVLIKSVRDAEQGYDYADYIPETLVAVVQQFIESHYPNARILEISGERGLTEIEILDGTTHRELYFEPTGDWVCTETEVRISDLPQAVREAFASSEYARYEIDEAELIESPEGTYYRLETEVNDRDTYLYYNANGEQLTM